MTNKTNKMILGNHCSVFWVVGTLGFSLLFLFQLIWVDGWSLRFGHWTVPLHFPWTGMFFLSLFLLVMETKAHLQKPSGSAFSAWFVFLLAQTVFLSTFRWKGCDDLSNSLLPFSLLREGTFLLDNYKGWFEGLFFGNVLNVNGHLVPFYPIMPALLAIPVYFLPVIAGVQPTNAVIHQLSKCSAVWMAALTVALLYKLFLSRTTSRRSFVLALLYAFGTPCFPISSQSLWQHGASCLMLVSCLTSWHHKKWGWLGFFSVLAVAARSTNGIFAVAFLLIGFSQGGRGAFFRIVKGGCLPAILLMTYWWNVLGQGVPGDLMRHGPSFSFYPHGDVVAAMLVSPFRGILLYVPIVVFCLCGVWRAYQQGAIPARVAVCFLGAVAASFWLFQSFSTWEGGSSVGTRFLFEGLTLLFYFLPFCDGGLSSSFFIRWGWRLAIGISLVSHIVPAYRRWEWQTVAEKTFPQSVWKWDSHPVVFELRNMFRFGGEKS
jgi:hypothetical protein